MSAVSSGILFQLDHPLFAVNLNDEVLVYTTEVESSSDTLILHEENQIDSEGFMFNPISWQNSNGLFTVSENNVRMVKVLVYSIVIIPGVIMLVNEYLNYFSQDSKNSAEGSISLLAKTSIAVGIVALGCFVAFKQFSRCQQCSTVAIIEQQEKSDISYSQGVDPELYELAINTSMDEKDSLLSSDDLRCPISQELMQDPVIDCYGHTYDRKYLEKWLGERQTSPITNKFLSKSDLRPNRTVAAIIEHRIKMLKKIE
ncbi:MAG: hypothetical protein K0S74_956 [Chlamydiales bacterium]|jgi:hypothetical protein|nr:hypothetical protein [Chlamydiales bacterium]